MRLIDGMAWTLLTTLEELRGHEEGLGARRPKGVVHGSTPYRTTWLEDRRREADELGYGMQPYVVIVVGARAGSRSGRGSGYCRATTRCISRCS